MGTRLNPLPNRQTIPNFSESINLRVEIVLRPRKKADHRFSPMIPSVENPGAASIVSGDLKRRKRISGTSAHTGTGYNSSSQ
jgi:hypothetical protein